MTTEPMQQNTTPVRRTAFDRLAAQVMRKGLLDDGATQAPPSPCVNVCRMSDDRSNPHAYCLGCYRRIDQIIGWGSASIEQKQAVWRDVLSRVDVAPSL